MTTTKRQREVSRAWREARSTLLNHENEWRHYRQALVYISKAKMVDADHLRSMATQALERGSERLRRARARENPEKPVG